MEVRGEMIMRPTVIEREILTGSAAHDYTNREDGRDRPNCNSYIG